MNLRVSASPTVSERTNPRSRFPKFIVTRAMPFREVAYTQSTLQYPAVRAGMREMLEESAADLASTLTSNCQVRRSRSVVMLSSFQSVIKHSFPG